MRDSGKKRYKSKHKQNYPEKQKTTSEEKYETSKMFKTSKGIKQGCIMSPFLFLILDEAIKHS